MHANARIAVELSNRGAIGRAAVAAAVALAFGPLAAHAADAPAPAPAAADAAEPNTTTLPEIVVTAERRETKLKDTPASVEAFTADRLDAQGIRGIDDLARVSPGVLFVRQGTSSSANYNDENSDIAIRGIDSNAGASTTGLYIDDTPIQTRHLQFGTVTAFPALFDLERVEVLRGPQGTLFGSGAEGGAIRFIQPEPSVKTSSAYARAEVGTTKNGAPSYEAGAAFGAPITEGKVGYRISASYRYDGGYVNRDRYNITNTDGATVPAGTPTSSLTNPLVLQDTGTVDSNSNWSKTETFRAALKFQLSPDTTITPSMYYQRLHINDTSVYWPALSNAGSGNFRSGNAQPNTSTDPFWLWAVKVDSDLGWARASSNTSYFDRNQSATTDYTQWVNTVFNGVVTSVPGPATTTAHFQDIQHNFTEELKLQSPGNNPALNWVAGLFFSHQYENTPETFGLKSSDPSLNPFPNPYPDGTDYVQNPYATTDRQIALFGQVDLEIIPKVKATVGLRVANIRTQGNGYFAGALVGGGTPPPSIVTAGTLTETPVTPKFGLSYQPDADNLFYTTIAKGYRVGGINSQVGGFCASSLTTLGISAAPATYKSDSLWSFEVGAKNTLLDHRLQIDSSAYFIDWKDIQHNIYLSCGLQFAANLGKATSKGFDVAMHLRATQSLTLGLDVGYTDARYGDTIYAGTPGPGKSFVTAGDVLSTTPWNVNLAADYVFPTMGRYDPYVHVDYQYTSGQSGLAPIQDSNNVPVTVSDPSTPPVVATRVMSLRGGARWDQFDASLYVNNVLNQAPVLFQSRDIVGSQLFFQRTLRPRTIGLTGTYRF